MPALTAGTSAPEINLSSTKGTKFSLDQALKRGPVVAAFFKISCPVCQLSLPYVERMYRAYPGSRVTIVGVSQDERDETESFAREYGISFPLLLDPEDSYPASNAYDLTNVPSIFLIADGEVKLSIVGWDKRDIEKLNAEVARASGIPAQPIFRKGEDVPTSKAG
ncbi:MAG TPA: TlpA disulfide reductase family protein [Terriglobales bacterium]|nr:TlpA disulfide reductase family protein [Terriglobales bacterium]